MESHNLFWCVSTADLFGTMSRENITEQQLGLRWRPIEGKEQCNSGTCRSFTRIVQPASHEFREPN